MIRWRRSMRLSGGLLTVPVVVLALFGVTIALLGRSRRSVVPLDLSKNGVHGNYNIMGEHGQIALYNFRAVDPGVLYRGSGFIRYGRVKRDGIERTAALDTSRRVFDILRAHNVKRIISLESREHAAAEQGYLDYWRRRTGYHIRLVSLPVAVDRGYANTGRDSALYAGAELVRLMQAHRSTDGATYIHCSNGADRTGVAVAVHELWRNQGVVPRDVLWQQVMDRYLVSNVLLGRLPDAARRQLATNDCQVACRTEGCAGEGCTNNYACRCWLNRVRFDLELLAQMPL